MTTALAPPQAATPPRQDLCPVAETIKIIGKKWYLILLHELTRSPMGFNELRRAVPGISAKVLSESLQELERRALVSRRVHSESPIRVEYSLTERGRDLDVVFVAMRSWGERWHICEEMPSPNALLTAPKGSNGSGETPPP